MSDGGAHGGAAPAPETATEAGPTLRVADFALSRARPRLLTFAARQICRFVDAFAHLPEVPKVR